MIVKILIDKFLVEKKTKPVNVNQLLDYASLCYLNNQITIIQYRSLMHELMLRGATKPEYYLHEEQSQLIC